MRAALRCGVAKKTHIAHCYQKIKYINNSLWPLLEVGIYHHIFILCVFMDVLFFRHPFIYIL
jgi:hypothetical protein